MVIRSRSRAKAKAKIKSKIKGQSLTRHSRGRGVTLWPVFWESFRPRPSIRALGRADTSSSLLNGISICYGGTQLLNRQNGTWRDWGNHPFVVIVVVLASLTAIIAFIRDVWQKPIVEPLIPSAAVIVEQSIVRVPANQYWHDTGIKVQKRDWLEFKASGSWWSGISMTGPEGQSSFSRNSCGACPIPDGNLGELVGKVGPDLFKVGKSSTQVVTQDSNLYLTMNENTGPCKDGRAGSCYEDNNGSLEVKITVWRIK